MRGQASPEVYGNSVQAAGTAGAGRGVARCPARCQGADGAGEKGRDQVSEALRVPARNLDYI